MASRLASVQVFEKLYELIPKEVVEKHRQLRQQKRAAAAAAAAPAANL